VLRIRRNDQPHDPPVVCGVHRREVRRAALERRRLLREQIRARDALTAGIPDWLVETTPDPVHRCCASAATAPAAGRTRSEQREPGLRRAIPRPRLVILKTLKEG
jgi:hypothetical protein